MTQLNKIYIVIISAFILLISCTPDRDNIFDPGSDNFISLPEISIVDFNFVGTTVLEGIDIVILFSDTVLYPYELGQQLWYENELTFEDIEKIPVGGQVYMTSLRGTFNNGNYIYKITYAGTTLSWVKFSVSYTNQQLVITVIDKSEKISIEP